MLAGCCCAAYAQPAASTDAPASTQPLRKRIVLPPGFKLASIAGRRVICEPDDVKLIQQTLLTLAPATRPTTMPIDLLTRLTQRRSALIKEMTDDLELPSADQAAALVDNKLTTVVKQFRDIEVPVYFLATTVQKLTNLVSSGWGGDWFTYNSATGQLMLKAGVTLDTEKPMDDIILPIIFADGATADQKVETIGRVVRSSEHNIQSQVAARAQVVIQLTIADFINDEAIVPLKLQPDQQWFRFGVCSVLSAKYLSQISGTPLSDIIARMTNEPEGTQVKAATVDLIHPVNAADLRDDVVPYYIEAMRRKSTLVIWNWTRGEGALLGKALDALRKTPAADGRALVQTIKQATGTDLSAKLSAGN